MTEETCRTHMILLCALDIAVRHIDRNPGLCTHRIVNLGQVVKCISIGYGSTYIYIAKFSFNTQPHTEWDIHKTKNIVLIRQSDESVKTYIHYSMDNNNELRIVRTVKDNDTFSIEPTNYINYKKATTILRELCSSTPLTEVTSIEIDKLFKFMPSNKYIEEVCSIYPIDWQSINEKIVSGIFK